MRMRLASLIICGAILTVAWTAPLSGQLCGSIQMCIGSSYEHQFQNWDFESEEFEDEGYHEDCLICYAGETPVTPENCHPPCSSLENDDQLALKQLLASVLEGDVRPVLAAAKEAPQFVLVNERRRSLQILSCDGSNIVANLPLGDLFDDAISVLQDRTTAAIAARAAMNALLAVRLMPALQHKTKAVPID